VTCLASLLGFEATGIEIQPALVAAARELAERHGISTRFLQGSIFPEGWDRSCLAPGPGTAGPPSLRWTDPELSPAGFDIIYAYPWPAEERPILGLFERFARPGALLVTYHGGARIRVARQAGDSST
jgi:hypothetical protein